MFSCKDCTDRKLGCHANCEKYLSEKAELAKEKERRRGDDDFRHYISDVIIEGRAANAKRKLKHDKYRRRRVK